MTDVAIIVEGQTEEAFVSRVLYPHLAPHDLNAWAVLPGRGARRRGGRWPWTTVRRDVIALLKERSGRRAGLLFDYYGLPIDWPGRAAAPSAPIGERAAVVERALREDLAKELGSSFNPALFTPHIQLHEFEARLFSDCDILGRAIGVDAEQLRSIVRKCSGPEKIDDGNTTAPSKRIESLSPGYRKTVVGVSVSERIGLDVMRLQCPHFGTWLDALESISTR